MMIFKKIYPGYAGVHCNCKESQCTDDKIMLDPGVGFGKTYEMNLEIINHLEIMKQLNYPVLLGTSRKSVIGLTLDLPADERVEGTLATTVIGVMKGCSFVRVHDVKENLQNYQDDRGNPVKIITKMVDEKSPLYNKLFRNED